MRGSSTLKLVPTQDALCAHRNRLDDVASLTDARVEQDGELPFFLGVDHPRRRRDLLESGERRNRAVNLSSTCSQASVSAYTWIIPADS